METTNSLQVLISTMNQEDYSLLDRINLGCDAVVINQCAVDNYTEFTYKSFNVKWVNMSKKGVGFSRNTALSYATADIVLWADDDMVYRDDYASLVLTGFAECKRADIICFNINLYNKNKELIGGHYSSKKQRLHLWNLLRYGAPTIAARRKKVLKERATFSLLFGGGAEFSSGEDSLFLIDCKKKGLNIFSNSGFLGDMDHSKSSWFTGYTDKFFIDKGRFYFSAFPRIYYLSFAYYALKFSRIVGDRHAFEIFQLFNCGKKEMKTYR